MQWLYGCILHILGIMIRKMYIPVQDRCNLYFAYGWIPGYKIYSMESQPYFAAWLKIKQAFGILQKVYSFTSFIWTPCLYHFPNINEVKKSQVTCWWHSSPEKPGMTSTQDALSNGNDVNKQTTQTKQTCSSIQKSGTWKWLRVLWSPLSVVRCHINLLQPRPEVAHSPNGLYSPYSL